MDEQFVMNGVSGAMRLSILNERSRNVSRVAMIALATVAVAGCSNDTGRFGEPIYTGSTPNQRQILGNQPATGFGTRQSQNWSTVDTTGSIAPAEAVVARQDLGPTRVEPVFTPATPVQSYAATPVVQPTYVEPNPSDTAQLPRVAAANGWTATGGSYVTLAQGDSLEGLSRRYGVPVSAIQQANGFSPANPPMPGSRVLIPVYSAAPAAAAAPQATAPAVRQIPITRPAVTPTVAVPSAVAPRPAAVPVQATAPRPLAVPTAAAPRPAAPVQVAAPQQVPLPPKPVVPPKTTASLPTSEGGVKLVGAYTVRPGDSLASIARTYGVSEAALKERNGLRSSTLQPGQHLLLPAGTKLMLKTSQAPAAPTAKPGQPAAAAKTQVAVAAPTAPAVPVAPVAVKPTAAAAKAAEAAQTRAEKIDQHAAETIALAKEPAPAEEAASSGAAGSFRWPVRGRIISEFGSKPNGEKNEGINLAVPEGTSVKSADDGEVIYSGNELKGYGNLVLVRHSNGYVTAYAHASELLVNRGDKVSRGQIIARAGATGSVTQPQLHFELRKGQRAVDPKPFLASN